MTRAELERVMAENNRLFREAMDTLLELEARYWKRHAAQLADQYREQKTVEAMFGRMRARRALKFHGAIVGRLEALRMGL